MNIRHFARVTTACITLGYSSAFASPAQDLFDQALYYLTFYYNGYTIIHTASLEAKYQSRLDEACKAQTNCGYDIASSVIDAMVDEIKDAHTYLIPSSEQSETATRRSDGSSEESLSMGFYPTPISTLSGTDLRVGEVLEGGGAEEAGLQRGDRIESFNNIKLSANPQDAMREFLQLDQSGQDIRLSVLRDGIERLQFNVASRRFLFTNLPWMNISKNVARIVVPDFDTFRLVAQKLHSLVRRAQSLNVKTIIVDLRDNPGGLATECLAGVSAFIPDVSRTRETRRERKIEGYRNGIVFNQDAQSKTANTVYEIDRPSKWTGNLTVLVNQESASCAEVFAADVQFAKRGTIIGERTYGLGNTSALGFDLLSGAGLYVTISKAFRLDGTPYPQRIIPDLFVRDNFDEFVQTGHDEMLTRALAVLN